MSHLRISGLRKRYGELEVVAGVDLDLRPGECFGLLGPNGAGKTTTLRLCLGLIEPDAGDIEMLGLGAAAIRARIPALLEFAGLGTRGASRIQTLSGGMKRRLTLARAMVNDPELIFLDEPTTGLDPQARHLIWERLRALLNQGKTIFLTTHFMDEAERLAHRVAIMDHGRIIALGAPRELIARHIEPQVVEVYGDGAEQWATGHGQRLAQRCEKAGETTFCYVHDAGPLVRDLEGREDLRYVHRHANLEDVFLKLTGRELRD